MKKMQAQKGCAATQAAQMSNKETQMINNNTYMQNLLKEKHVFRANSLPLDDLAKKLTENNHGNMS